MDLGDAIFRLVSGGRSPRERYHKGWITEGIARAGGVSQLARALGVARTTVQRWVNAGKEPTVESQELLRAALRTARMGPRREAALRAKTELVVRGEQDGRDRTIHLDAKYLAGGTMDKVVTAYLNGASPRDLQRVVWTGIHSAPFYKSLFHPGGPEAQKPASRAPRTPAEPSTGGGGGAGGGPGSAGGGGYYQGAVADFYDPEEDVIYEGTDLDDDYGMLVSYAR